MIQKSLLITFIFFLFFTTVVFAEKSGVGIFDDHIYKYKGMDDKKIMVRFTPPLPRNDAILTNAMLHLINEFYGSHKLKDLTPKLVRKGKFNVIKFQGVNYDYFFFPIKNDSGEVHSLVFWGEQ